MEGEEGMEEAVEEENVMLGLSREDPHLLGILLKLKH